MFQEWSRNRYGVFPESGFAGDPLYPDFYTDDEGEVSVNEDCDGLAEVDRSDIARSASNNGTAVSEFGVFLHLSPRDHGHFSPRGHFQAAQGP